MFDLFPAMSASGKGRCSFRNPREIVSGLSFEKGWGACGDGAGHGR